MESLNSFLLNINNFLYPYQSIIFYLSLIYGLLISFYYKFMSPEKLIAEKKIRNAMFYSGFATFMLSYSLLLEYREPEFLENLFIFFPVCTLLPPVLLISFLWIAYCFSFQNKKYEIYRKQ